MSRDTNEATQATTAAPDAVELGHLTIQSLVFRMDKLEVLQEPVLLPKIDVLKQLFVSRCIGGNTKQHLVTSYLEVTGLYSLTDNIGQIYKYSSHISTVVSGVGVEGIDRWALEHCEALLIKKGSIIHDGLCVENIVYNTLLVQRDLSVIPTELFSHDLNENRGPTVAGYLN